MLFDISGAMIVGRHVEDIAVLNDLDCEIYEWVEENDLDYMSPHYDARTTYWVVGYKVKDIPVKDMTGGWVVDVLKLAEKFKELTGEDAHLIGMHNVY